MIKSLSVFLSAAAIAVLAAGQPVRCEPANAHLVLRVAMDKSVFRKGDFPQTQAVIINRGAAPVTLVEPGDGSDFGLRTPIVGWSILPANGTRAQHPNSIPAVHALRCGNMNSLKFNELFNLTPGSPHLLPAGAFDEAWSLGIGKRPAGKYRIVFYYQNDPSRPLKGIPFGKQDPAVMTQVQSSTPCFLVSNEIVVTVLN